MKPKILLVEDEPAIADTIIYALNTDGFEAVWMNTSQAALAELEKGPFALAVFDVGLPDINGFELYRRVRLAQHQNASLPIIFLTARSEEIDRVVGLELGADDYISKPFSPRELVARIRNVLRRAQLAPPPGVAAPATTSQTGNSASTFVVDDERKQIKFCNVALDLSKNEYRLLKTLVQRPGRVYSREELMQAAWDHPEFALDRTVDAHVKQVRAKLRQVNPELDPIVTHRGMGYSLKESL